MKLRGNFGSLANVGYVSMINSQEHRSLTRVYGLPRLSFSRSGLVSLIFQKSLSTFARACSAIGAKNGSRALRKFLEENRATYRRICTRFFESVLSSGEYSLYVDFGAHIGEQVLIAQKYMDVLAFEPDVRVFQQLKRNTQANEASTYKVSLENVAISDVEGYARLNYSDKDPSSTGGSTLESDKSGHTGGVGTVCRTVDVMEVLEQIPDLRRTIIKIDIEGAEYRVLQRMMRHPHFSQVGLIFVEFHERKMARGTRLGIVLTARLWSCHLRRSRLIEWL